VLVDLRHAGSQPPPLLLNPLAARRQFVPGKHTRVIRVKESGDFPVTGDERPLQACPLLFCPYIHGRIPTTALILQA
jgi:hypothetical protein